MCIQCVRLYTTSTAAVHDCPLTLFRVHQEMDYNLAKHVTYVHQFKAAPEVDRDAIFDAGFLRAYIAKVPSTPNSNSNPKTLDPGP